MADPLTDYIHAAMREPFVWGRSDCVTFVCDWALAKTGHDPMAPWRGRYRSGLGAAECLAEYGGLAATMDYGLHDLSGLARTDDPQAGDIGVVSNGRPLCAIFTGLLWAARRRGGIILFQACGGHAWSLGQPLKVL